jgi:hypothetical protein
MEINPGTTVFNAEISHHQPARTKIAAAAVSAKRARGTTDSISARKFG